MRINMVGVVVQRIESDGFTEKVSLGFRSITWTWTQDSGVQLPSQGAPPSGPTYSYSV
jgi:hypothetical protein